MDRLRFYFCLLIILMVGWPSLTLTQTPSQLFHQGLLKENGEGDLKAAVAIYEKVVGEATAERSLRARALLHIGMCWRRSWAKTRLRKPTSVSYRTLQTSAR